MILPEWSVWYAISMLAGGIFGVLIRWIKEEIELTKLVREKLGPYHR